jgi:hypothetical protein
MKINKIMKKQFLLIAIFIIAVTNLTLAQQTPEKIGNQDVLKAIKSKNGIYGANAAIC